MKAPMTSPHAGRMRRLKALIVKESLQVVRDPSSILIAFVLPLILLFLFGYGVSLDARQVRLGVVLEDSSPEARRLAASFQVTPFFDARTALDRHTLEADLISSRLRGVVIIPLVSPGPSMRRGRRPRCSCSPTAVKPIRPITWPTMPPAPWPPG